MHAPRKDTRFGCFPIPAKIESSRSKRSYCTPHTSSSISVLTAQDCPLYTALNTVPKRPFPTFEDMWSSEGCITNDPFRIISVASRVNHVLVNSGESSYLRS
jgi:hypothetical protein